MNKGKTRGPIRKYMSVVLVPHSSSEVKVLKFSSFYGKLTAAFMLLAALLISSGILLYNAMDENRRLRENNGELYGINTEQRKLLGIKEQELAEQKKKEETFNQKIKEVNEKYKELTDKYISGQSTAKTSRSGDRSDRSFNSDISGLKSELSELNQFFDHTADEPVDLSDSEGKLRKYMDAVPTLWPVTGRLSDKFGYRIHPITHRKTYHEGLDIAAPYGTTIRAAASGKVTMSERNGGYGRTVVIDHGRGISTLYGHASKLLVEAGQTVKKGDPVAKVGSSGRSTGPHLHFEILLYGSPADPLQYLDEKYKKDEN